MEKAKKRNRIAEFFKNLYYMHYIAVAISLGFIAMAVFIFPNGIIRIWESLKDLWYSLGYYFVELFELDYIIAPTVNNYSVVPWTPIFGLPATFDEFKVLWVRYWEIFVTIENISAYLLATGDVARIISQGLLCFVVPVFLLLYICFQRYFSKVNNDYDKDSRMLRFAKWLARYTYKPVVAWIKRFIAFIGEHKGYRILWLLIWAYNFNVITIFIEFLAFYLYFVISFDALNLYRQVYKLFCDISVPVAFIPGWCWFIIAYIVLCVVRKNIGYTALRIHEARNKGFINERPIAVMACGTVGKKKTTLITDMTLLQEKMFRDKALEKLIENDLKFPNFPWIKLEKYLQYAMKKHIVYNLATIRRLINRFRECFCEGYKNPSYAKSIRRHLKKRYGYKYSNLIFDYDFQKYGIYYDDKLKLEEIFSVIKTYAQLYFVYVIKSTFVVSNYAIRTDAVTEDMGNLPMRNAEFYERNSAFIYELSTYSKIIDFNAMRLGKLFGDENDPKKDSFEFGVVVITEGGKERKNNLQLQELKKKDEVANQKNDGFNDWLKMIRHSGTIDYIPFCRVFLDEQRPESWGADGRDLCEIVHIKDGGETKLAMPFFVVEELLYSFVYNRFVNLYLKYRYVRGDNTLPMYLFKKIMGKLQAYYKGIYNTFGYAKMTLEVEAGTMDGEKLKRYYYLDNKRIYADRFSTDAFSEFFTTKSLRSSIGLDDLEAYGSSKATFEELQKQNSYFIADLVHKQERDN